MESRGWRVVLGIGALVLCGAAALTALRVAGTPATAESIAAQAARARGGPAQAGGGAAADAPPAIPLLNVFVSGAVLHPGIYQLPKGSRVADAIDAAGGLLPDADPDKLPNLAGRLTDGKQVKVARFKSSTRSAASKLDINSASLAELLAVPGMDPSTAQAIVNERESYGPFASLTELHTVLGLDTAALTALRPYLRVG